uniref:Uncharacterized protein n=1 Tax=Solanum tuberosum TaxID=4113 RepID=M1CJP2_SOLTU
MESGVSHTGKGCPTCQGKDHELLAIVDPLDNVYLNNPMFAHSLWDMEKRKEKKSGSGLVPENARYFSVGDNTLLSFGIDPSSSLRCKGNVREGERRRERMGGMKAISGGMGLSHEDAKLHLVKKAKVYGSDLGLC